MVFIMADDLDTSVWKQALDRGALPNIKAELVDKGTTFRQSFASLSTCCPSRVTYLTGQYPHNHGVVTNDGPKGGFAAFAKDDATIAKWLQDAGYRTGLMGKYLNSYGSTPKDAKGSYVPPGWEVWRGLMNITEYNYNISVDGVRVHYGSSPQDYQTDVLAGMAEAFLRSADSRPFFLTITATAPHYEGIDEDGGYRLAPAPRHLDTPRLGRIPPEKLRSFNEAAMGDKPMWMRDEPLVDVTLQREGFNSKIAAMRAVDDLVGRVIDALSDSGRLDRTVIFFTSDNGYQYGTHRLTGKTDIYEESIRVPLVVRTPGRETPLVSEEWINNTDWAPTVLDYAGVQPPGIIDGQSFRAHVEQENALPRRHSILVEVPGDGTARAQHAAVAMVRTKDPSLTFDASGTAVFVYAETYGASGTVTDLEVYDLRVDPLQLSNSAAQLPAPQKASLASRLATLRTCKGITCVEAEK